MDLSASISPLLGLQALANNLWIVQQPLRFLGLRVGTRMTIVRLDDGRLNHHFTD